MTRNEALEIARANHKAHTAADIAHMFGRGPAITDALAQFGFRNGWYRAGEFSFNVQDLTGEQYDITQGGWAFI